MKNLKIFNKKIKEQNLRYSVKISKEIILKKINKNKLMLYIIMQWIFQTENKWLKKLLRLFFKSQNLKVLKKKIQFNI